MISSMLIHVRHLIGNIGWKLYIWSYYSGDVSRYIAELEEDFKRYHGLDAAKETK